MRVIILNPYSNHGGAGEFQPAIKEICRKHFGEQEVTTCSVSPSKFGRYYRCIGYLETLIRSVILQSKIKNNEVVIIQGHYNPGSWVFGIAALHQRKKLIIIPHGDFIPTAESETVFRNAVLKNFCWRFIGRRLIRGASRVVVGSKLEAAQYLKQGIAQDRLQEIPNPMAYTQCSEATVCRSNTQPFALWLGRISSEKGLDLLLETWRILEQKGIKIVLKIYGTCEDRSLYRDLKKKVHRYGLIQHVEFGSWVNGDAKNKLIADARCVLLPSYVESFGRVVPEAIAMRTPVIAAKTTPWGLIEQLGCSWLERNPERWAKAVLDQCNTPKKQYLDEIKCNNFLFEYSDKNVLQKWKALFTALQCN